MPDFNRDTCEFFLKKAEHPETDEKLRMFCIEKAISFLHHADHIKQFASWITNEEGAKHKLIKTQKYAVLKTYYSCNAFTREEKEALR